MGYSIGNIRPGISILYNDELYAVVECEHAKLGRGSAFCRARLRNLKTSQVVEVISNIGLQSEIDRVKSGRTIRAGKGKRRGRKYKTKKGPLIVIKDDFGIYKAARNISGVDVINIENLNCKNLAPGAHIGRLVLWSQSAFKHLEKLEV